MLEEEKILRKEGYDYFVKHMENLGFDKSQIDIDEERIKDGTDLALMHSLELGSVGPIIEIIVPTKEYISIRGKYQPKSSRKESELQNVLASRLTLTINDLDPRTKIQINKQINSQIEKEETIDTIYYAELPFYFRRNILLSGYKLKINIVSPNIHIDKEKIKFNLGIDYWQRI